MPSNQIKYTIGIDADTRQAQKSIQELQSALNAITTANNKKLGLDIDLSNAAKAAEQLQHSIQSAVNVDTGRLNFTAFNKSLMQSNTNLSQLITQLRSTGGLGNQAVSQLARSLSTAEIPVKRMTGLLGNFATTLANSFKWQISSNIIHGMQSALSSAVGYAQDLNETLNNIRIVTGQSVDDMAKFAVSANQAAKELSTTTKEFANASLIYYQQGDSAELAAKKAATTVKAANVAFTASAKEMSEMLTAVWNSYQVGEDQLERTVDVMAKLGATTASSMEEMATAMQKVASTANTVGVSMQQMSAIVATSASVTRQAPETVGTAWNTILSRIGGLKLGETLEDGVDLNKYSNALRTVGVNILDATGNLRDMGGVIDELGAKWQTLNKGQKAALAQTIGGARQYTQIMAFFENFDKYQKNIITAQNSAGALQEQQEIYAQGWEAARDRSRAALEELWDVLIDDEAMISFTNGMTKMTEGVTGLVKAFGGLPGILATVSTLMTRTFSNQIATNIGKAVGSVSGFFGSFKSFGGDYTVKQFLTGQMPSAQNRALIENLNAVSGELNRTATGWDINKDNPYAALIMDNANQQANFLQQRIDILKNGQTVPANLNLQYVGYANANPLFNQAYQSFNTTDNVAGIAYKDIVSSGQGRMLFRELNNELFRELIDQTELEAQNAGGADTQSVYQQRIQALSQFIDPNFEKRENYADIIARYQRSARDGFLSKDLDEKTIEDIGNQILSNGGKIRQGINNQYILPQDLKNAELEQMGRTAAQAAQGLTSAAMGFNQMNAAMHAFNAGDITQGLTSLAIPLANVVQMAASGNKVGAAIAGIGSVLGIVVGLIQNYEQKIAEEVKKSVDKVTESVNSISEKSSTILTAAESYNNLNSAWQAGTITIDEYHSALLDTANALEVQGANVLALAGNYEELNAKVQDAIQSQLHQQELNANATIREAEANMGNLAYNALEGNGFRGFVNRKDNNMSQFIAGTTLESINFLLEQSGYSQSATELLGLNSSNGLDLTIENLRKFISGYALIQDLVKQIPSDELSFYDSNIGNFADGYLNAFKGLIETVNPAETAIYNNHGTAWLNKNFTSAIDYDSKQRTSLTEQFLEAEGLTDTDPVYNVAKQAFESLLDAAVAGMVDGGQLKSETAATAAAKQEDWRNRLKRAGYSEDQINNWMQRNTGSWTKDIQWINSPEFEQVFAGVTGSTTAVSQMRSAESLLSSWYSRDKNFNLDNLASIIFSSPELSSQFMSQKDWNSSSTDDKYDALLKFIDFVDAHQSEWADKANQEQLDINTQRDNELKALSGELDKEFNLTLNDLKELTQVDIDEYNTLKNKTEPLTETEQASIDRVEQFGGVEAAQAMLYRYQGLGQLSVDNFDVTEKKINDIVAETNTLMGMDLSSSKWGESFQYIVSLLKENGKSFSDWLGMSDLEKQQFQLEVVRKNIEAIHELQASGEKIDENQLLQLEHDAQQLEQTINDIELTNFKNQMQEITDEWDKMRKNAQSALSLISSNLKNLGNLSFSDLEELRQTLLDAGLEAEHVAQILDDMRHAGEKGASKEDIWAGVMASTTAALMSVTADMEQASGVEDLISKDVVKKIDLSLGENNEVQTFIDNLSPQSIVLEKSSESTLPETVEIDLNNINLAIAEGKIKEIKHDLENNELIITTVDDQEYVLKAKQWEFDFEKRELNVEMPEGEKITSTIDHWSLSLSGEKELKVKLKDETGETEEITTKVDNIVAKITNNDKGYTCQFVLKDQNNKDLATIADNFQMAFQKLEDTNEVAITFTNDHGEVITGVLPQEVKDLLDQLPPNHEIQLSFLEPTKESQEILNNALEEKEKTIKIKYTDPSGNVYEWNTSKNSAPTMTPAFKNEATKFNDLLGITTPTLDKTTSTKNKRNQIALNDKQLSLITNTTKWLSSQEGGTFTPDILNKNTWGDISKQFSDLNELGRGAIGDLVFSLEDALKSKNSTIENAAKMVLDGLKQGLLLAGQKDDWNNYVNGLGDKIDAAFRLQLLIQSPSRLTMALAPYLIEGLQVGLTNAIAGWTPNVDGLSLKLSKAIQTEIQNVLKDTDLKEQWIQENLANYEDYGDALLAWNNGAGIDGDQITRSQTLSILNGENLNDNQRWALESAKDMIHLPDGKMSLSQLTDEELLDYLNKVQINIDNYFMDLFNSQKSVKAQIQDIWGNAIDLIFAQDEEAAQSTYNLWKDTFEAIASARSSLLNGDSIMDGMKNDIESQAKILRYLMETKQLTYDEATKFMRNPNADYQALQFEAFQGAQKEKLISGADVPFYQNGQYTFDNYRNLSNEEQWSLYRQGMRDYTETTLLGSEKSFLNYLTSAYQHKNDSTQANALYNNLMNTSGTVEGQRIKLSDLINFNADDLATIADGHTFEEIIHTLFTEDTITAWAKKLGYQSIEAMQEGMYEAAANANNSQYMSDTALLENYAKAANMTTKEFEQYAQALENADAASKLMYADTEQGREYLYKYTLSAIKAEKGLADLKKGYKENIKAVQSLSKGINNEGLKSLQTLKTQLSDIFNVQEEFISDDFIKKNLKLIEQMAKGSKKAAKELETLLKDDISSSYKDNQINFDVNQDGIMNGLDTVGAMIDSFAEKYANTPIGVVIDDSQALAGIQAIYDAGITTANNITAAFNAISWDPQIEWEAVDGSTYAEQHMSGGYYLIDGKYVPVDNHSTEEIHEKVYIPHIKGMAKTATGSQTPSSGSKGGGGGGGKQHQKKDPIRPQDEIERYHEIRDQIEKLGNALDKVDKIKTKTFGQKHLDALKEEIALLKQENGLQQEYYAEAARYLAADRADLMHYGAATFNADGTVNYEEYMQNIIAEVNRRFAASESDEEDEAAQQWYDDAKKALENYEEALDLVDTTQNDILDNLNEISALTLEAAQYRLEIRVDLNDSDIEILDYYISKWEKMLSQQDESMEASIGQVYKYEDSLSALGDTFSELIYAHNTGDLNDSDFVEGLKDVRDQVFDTLGSINDLQNTIAEWYGQTLDKAEEELDKYTSKISHSRDVMQTYIEMQQLMGKGADYRALQNMYTFAYESSLENAKAAREYVDILKEAREVILQQAEEYGWTDTLKQQFDDIEAHIIEAENTLLENTQQTLEDAKAEFENTMSAIIKEVDNAFTALKDANGDLKKSFSEVADEYSFWTEQQGWYVSTAKELYEVSKINRKIEDSIAGATTQQSKERLKLLQEEINAYAEKNRLTEYDIKMNELQYEMALAMQGLEDAGNSKQTVRLTRDENGNYGYQYTADQDEMDAARQKYEDVLQQINELSDEYQKEVAQKWIDAEQQFWEKVQEISQDTTLTVEERQRRIEELTAQHLETMQYYHDEYNKASEQLLTNQGYIQEHYGQTIMANTGMVQDQLNTTIDMMIGDTERYMSHITEEALPAISKAMEIYKGDLDATKEATNLSWEAMGDSVQAYRGINQLARQDIQNTDQVLRNTLSGISNATAKWLEHSNSLRTTITSYESLGNSINGIISKLNSVTSAANTAASAIRNMQSASYSSYSGSRSSSSNSPGGSSSPGGAKSPAAITTAPATSNSSSKGWVSRFTARTGTKVRATAFSTGGLDDVTGWHYLHGTLQRPELVLNADDTQNMLKMVNILHNLSPEMLSALRGTVNGSAYSALAGLSAMSAHSINSTTSELNQNVEIHADFPNVTDKNEIIDAFDNLVNLATQYANRKG